MKLFLVEDGPQQHFFLLSESMVINFFFFYKLRTQLKFEKTKLKFQKSRVPVTINVPLLTPILLIYYFLLWLSEFEVVNLETGQRWFGSFSIKSLSFINLSPETMIYWSNFHGNLHTHAPTHIYIHTDLPTIIHTYNLFKNFDVWELYTWHIDKFIFNFIIYRVWIFIF